MHARVGRGLQSVRLAPLDEPEKLTKVPVMILVLGTKTTLPSG